MKYLRALETHSILTGVLEENQLDIVASMVSEKEALELETAGNEWLKNLVKQVQVTEMSKVTTLNSKMNAGVGNLLDNTRDSREAREYLRDIEYENNSGRPQKVKIRF